MRVQHASSDRLLTWLSVIRGRAFKCWISLACIGFEEVYTSGKELPEEIKGSGPRGREAR